MDVTGLKAAVEEINSKSIPELEAAGHRLLDHLEKILHRLLDRIQFASAISIRPKGEEQ